MSEAVEVTVSFRVNQAQSEANLLSAASDVPIRMIVGTDAHTIHLSRVPTVGERICFRGQDYTVRDVRHMPGTGRAAEITVVIAIGND